MDFPTYYITSVQEIIPSVLVHTAWEKFEKAVFFSTGCPSVDSNLSGKQSVFKTLFKTDEFGNGGIAF